MGMAETAAEERRVTMGTCQLGHAGNIECVW